MKKVFTENLQGPTRITPHSLTKSTCSNNILSCQKHKLRKRTSWDIRKGYSTEEN